VILLTPPGVDSKITEPLGSINLTSSVGPSLSRGRIDKLFMRRRRLGMSEGGLAQRQVFDFVKANVV
jgi:hypothetical protein